MRKAVTSLLLRQDNDIPVKFVSELYIVPPQRGNVGTVQRIGVVRSQRRRRLTCSKIERIDKLSCFTVLHDVTGSLQSG